MNVRMWLHRATQNNFKLYWTMVIGSSGQLREKWLVENTEKKNVFPKTNFFRN